MVAPAERLRVLLVLGTSTGGVGRHVHTLATGLARRGHEVVVAGPAAVERRLDLRPSGARFVPVELGGRPSPGHDPVALARLRRLAAGADVVHAHGARAGALAGLVRRRRVPVVVTLHNAAPQGRAAALVYRVLERLVAARAALVLGVSADLVESARALGATRVALAVVPAPEVVDGPAPDAGAVRRRLGLGALDRLVVVTARLAPQKGLGLLLDAVRLLDAGHTGGRLLVAVAGDGPLRPVLTDRIAAEDLPVRLLGHRDDVPALLAAADVVVSSSLWEGQPVGLQEALRAGAAIVATDVGGTAAVLGGGGRLVPGGDPRALADGIRLVLADDVERDRLRGNATRRASELPTADDAVLAALGHYREVVRAVGADRARPASPEGPAMT